jgi:ATP-dependent Clp protease ATP-binding subunit ClpX
VSATQKLRCSFCGRREDQVKRLIAGEKALICDRCVVDAARTMKDAADDTNPAHIGNKPVT